MKIVILDSRETFIDWTELKRLGNVTQFEIRSDDSSEEETIARIGDAEIVVTCKNKMGRKTFDRCPNIKLVAIPSTGFDVVDVAAAKEHGVKVCNVPTYATEAVAQFTFALILELCHAVGDHNRSVQNGDWSRCKDFCYWLSPQVELAGKTIGIIGYGRIGRQVGRIAEAFGMKVLYHSPHGEKSVSLDTLFSQADVISLNCRLTEENHHVINAESIAKMKDGVFIVNTARGPLINEVDLVAALESGKVGGAAMDVVTGEPIREDNPLLGAKNCLITPHIAWSTEECRARLADVTMKNIQAFLDGHPTNIVNE